jgi:hypothetical protein
MKPEFLKNFKVGEQPLPQDVVDAKTSIKNERIKKVPPRMGWNFLV